MNREYLTKLINNYTDACVAYSWAGGGHPEDIPILREWLTKSKEKLFKYIERNTNP